MASSRTSAALAALTILGTTLTVAGPAHAAVPTCQGKAATIVGTDSAERIVGTTGDDVIIGRGGNDIIVGRGGNDVICGGPGGDRIWGGYGNDSILGNSGPDYVNGGPGKDMVNGGWGDDEVHGGAGADKVYGSRNADKLYGGDGIDQMWGGNGHDQMWGGKHNDTLSGGNGNDVLFGGVGDDRLRPGSGGGRNVGGDGADRVNGQLETPSAPSAPSSGEPTVAAPTAPTIPSTVPVTTAPVATAPVATAPVGPMTEEAFELAVADEIFRLTNCARTGDYSSWCEQGDESRWNVTPSERAGLTAYQRVASLDRGAKAWSRNMAENIRSLQHGTPGEHPWHAENIAYNGVHGDFTLQEANAAAKRLVDQWMTSTSGHRQAMLSSRYVTFGSGVEAHVDGFHRLYATQWFAY